MPDTVQNKITLALKDSGVLGIGQIAQAEYLNDSFVRLNQMLAQWQRKRWLIWHLIDLHVVSTGAQSYTVGPGGDINVLVRPDRLESAFFRQVINASPPNEIDYPLEILESREDYNRIALKQLQSFSRCIFYDSAWPLGAIYPWPVPQPAIYEVHISVKELLNAFTSLAQVVDLPSEYDAAINFCLQQRLRAAYRLPPDPEINALAKDALNTLRMANFQIARLQMPRALMRPAGYYNVYSDQIR